MYVAVYGSGTYSCVCTSVPTLCPLNIWKRPVGSCAQQQCSSRLLPNCANILAKCARRSHRSGHHPRSMMAGAGAGGKGSGGWPATGTPSHWNNIRKMNQTKKTQKIPLRVENRTQRGKGVYRHHQPESRLGYNRPQSCCLCCSCCSCSCFAQPQLTKLLRVPQQQQQQHSTCIVRVGI